MKTTILNLKNEIEPYYSILQDECELTVILYKSLDMILENQCSDASIQEWLNLNKPSIDIIRDKIKRIENLQEKF